MCLIKLIYLTHYFFKYTHKSAHACCTHHACAFEAERRAPIKCSSIYNYVYKIILEAKCYKI